MYKITEPPHNLGWLAVVSSYYDEAFVTDIHKSISKHHRVWKDKAKVWLIHESKRLVLEALVARQNKNPTQLEPAELTESILKHAEETLEHVGPASPSTVKEQLDSWATIAVEELSGIEADAVELYSICRNVTTRPGVIVFMAVLDMKKQ